MLVLPVYSFAQLVAMKDLSYPGYSPADVAIGGIYKKSQLEAELESCIKAGRQPHASHTDGVTGRIKLQKLELEIISAEPHLISEGRELTLVVRITNKGESAVDLPWMETIVETQSPDESDSPRKSVDYVSIETALKTHEKKFELNGGVSLQARLSQPQHWITVKPREWAEIKFRASLHPRPNEVAVPSDPAAVLSASWSESTFAEARAECSIHSEYFAGGRLESKPFPIVIAPMRR
jgi:hypothetical protein